METLEQCLESVQSLKWWYQTDVIDAALLSSLCFYCWRFKYNQKLPYSQVIAKSLCKKCANTEIFLVRIFPYSVQIRKNTDQKKLHIWTLFSQWYKNIEKLQLVREMITQVVVCCAIIILRTLQYDSNIFKQTTSTWCWSKSNTTNEFHWKSRSSRRCNNIFHYWRSGKNNLRFF